MSLTEEQKQKVTAWIAEGANPAAVQTRLEKEFGMRTTYMDVRFLIDDLKIVPKDPEPPKPPEPVVPAAPAAPAEPAASAEVPVADALSTPPAGAGKVSVVVDDITRPGAVVSGSVTFTDGKRAGWLLDQMGRLGFVPDEQGYRPSQEDFAEFQTTLEQELVKLGI